MNVFPLTVSSVTIGAVKSLLLLFKYTFLTNLQPPTRSENPLLEGAAFMNVYRLHEAGSGIESTSATCSTYSSLLQPS